MSRLFQWLTVAIGLVAFCAAISIVLGNLKACEEIPEFCVSESFK